MVMIIRPYSQRLADYHSTNDAETLYRYRATLKQENSSLSL